VPAPLELLLDWIDVPSVTGEEADYADLVARHLGALGLSVERQEAAPGRANLLARAGEPRVVLCTHLDTVPPWFGPSREGGVIRGRGACDAKGPALAMAEAVRLLLAEGEDRVGLLLTVGEELDSIGAKAANRAALPDWRPAWTIVGEPTENRFVRGHKGAFKGTLVARGVAGHSSQPVGPSAVHELVGCAHRLLSGGWGEDPLFGPGTLNLGTFTGGVAPNVVADEARASVLVRAVEEPEAVRARIHASLGEHVSFEEHGPVYGPMRFHFPEDAEPDQDGGVVAYGTDAPHLSGWGTRLLYGPGRILDAHTDHECLEASSFERAVHDYARTVRSLLALEDARA
jgi:acetylornithine deacetylase